MTNVLLVTHYFAAHRGGVELAASNIAKILSQNKSLTITWLAADCDKGPDESENLKSIPLKSYNFIEKLLPFPYPLISVSGIIKLFNEVKKCDVVHIHDFLYHSNLSAFFCAKFLKKKIIITQHIGFIPYKNSFLKFLLNFINRTLGKYILNKCDEVVFISQNVMKYFKEECKLSGIVLFQPNPVNNKLFLPLDNNSINTQLNNLKKTEHKKIFLFVGRFTEKKGLNFLKNIIVNFPESLWIFAGWGQIDPDSWKYNNVITYKYCDQFKLNSLYNIADYLILPSYGEGFPLVIQEAFSAGLPVITSEENATAFPEVLKYMITLNIDDEGSCINKISSIENNLYKTNITKEDLINFSEKYWSESACRKFYSELIMNPINKQNK